MIIFVICLIIVLVIGVIIGIYYNSVGVMKERSYAEVYRQNNINNTTPFLMRCNNNLLPIPREVVSIGVNNGIDVVPPGFKIKQDGAYRLETVISASTLDCEAVIEITFFRNEAIGSLSSSTIRKEVDNISLIGTIQAKVGDFIEIRIRSKEEIQIAINYIIFSIMML